MHVGYIGKIGQVKDSLVGLPVAAHQPRPVDGKYHRQILYTDVMQYLVIGSLQKRGIYCHNGFHAPRCQARRKRHGM